MAIVGLLLMFLGNTDHVFARGKCQGGSTLPSLNAAAFFSDVVCAPHPERVLQGDQVSPAHQSSSGRPGWSQKLLHTAAQGSLCPTPDVCCTPDKTTTSAHLSDRDFSPVVLPLTCTVNLSCSCTLTVTSYLLWLNDRWEGSGRIDWVGVSSFSFPSSRTTCSSGCLTQDTSVHWRTAGKWKESL